jgi:hypothetical protein
MVLSAMKSCSDREASLSSFCNCGLRPRVVRILYLFVLSKDLWSKFALHWLDMDIIYVVFIRDEYHGVDHCGGLQEMASGTGVKLAC